MAKASAAKMRYMRKWKNENIRQIKVECNTVHDADVLAKLDQVDNKAGYIKELIRADIARG